ncbi:MAG: nucleotide exchange factor GrpE [Bdellovibrionales bacterium]|nr:nucleotide exchange factor GrpE [Bdellovibrionales bacterium]
MNDNKNGKTNHEDNTDQDGSYLHTDLKSEENEGYNKETEISSAKNESKQEDDFMVAKAKKDSAEEVNKLKNDLLYLGAEFENYKRHAIRERSEMIKYAGEKLIRELLDITDNFERALSMKVTEENWQSFCEGVNLINKEFKTLLTKFGVVELNPLGQAFDPSSHEALTSEETDKVAPGAVSRVFKKAYKYHDRLLRPAQVVVAKAPSSKAELEE